MLERLDFINGFAFINYIFIKSKFKSINNCNLKFLF